MATLADILRNLKSYDEEPFEWLIARSVGRHQRGSERTLMLVPTQIEREAVLQQRYYAHRKDPSERMAPRRPQMSACQLPHRRAPDAIDVSCNS